MNGKIWLRILSGLVLVAAIAGIAFFAFQAGVAQGSPVTIQAPSGESAQMPYYGMPFGYRGFHPMPFFGFGCFGILIPLFLLFLAMRAFRFAFWGPRWGHHMHGHGPWGRGHWGEGNVPPMFDEWHKRAHGETPAEDKKE
ncbi:MAG: hypothetical protein HYZ25_21685 [Chloroflexi bacterium]|nr:hypothetical protein [Chloroflexota bacterium]